MVSRLSVVGKMNVRRGQVASKIIVAVILAASFRPSAHASAVPSPYSYFADKNEAALTDAAINGDAIKVSRLIKSGVSPNDVSKDGIPILAWAYLANNKTGFKALLDAHANPEVLIPRRFPSYLGASIIE